MACDEQQAEALFYAVLECRDATVREQLLLDAGRQDPELRARVERLLAAEAESREVLAIPEPPPAGTKGSIWIPSMPANAAPSRTLLAGRYVLLELLGEGGMGMVYRAEQVAPMQRVVAIKLLKAGLDSHEVVRRFDLERQTLARMDHPDIARIFDAGVTEAMDGLPPGLPYFVMEYVPGVPITRFCEAETLDLRARLELVIAICEAVQHAHQKGIIHRDLKPGNVLVSRIDGQPRAKVIDFGVAKSLGDVDENGSPASSPMTMGLMVGTIDYMSPEQAEFGSSRVDTRSDIYSLGALLYELLTGQVPLPRHGHGITTLWDALRSVHEQTPMLPSVRLTEQVATASRTDGRLPPTIRPRALRGELDAIALKCLEKEPDQRYRSARDLADDLRRFLEGRSVSARRSSAVRRAARWCRRNPLTAGLSVLAVVALLGGAATSSYFAVAEARRAVAEAAARHDSQIQLARAQISEARALRMSGRPGQRFAALRALDAARTILGPTRELADETVAALSLPDWELDFAWRGFVPGTVVLALAPNMHRYARADRHGRIEIRDLPDDRLLGVIDGLGKPADYGGLRFSDNGRVLLEAYDAPRRWLRAWRLASTPQLICESDSGVGAVQPNGRAIAVERGTALEYWDVESGSLTYSVALPGRSEGRFLAWHPTRSCVAIAANDGWQLCDWETQSLGTLQRLPVSGWPAFHPHGAWAAWPDTNAQPATHLIDIATGNQLGPDMVAPASGGSLAFFDRGGEVLFTNDWRGVLRMWEPRTGRQLLQRPSRNFNDIVTDEAGERIGPEIAGDECRVWRYATGREFRRLGLGADRAAIVPQSELVALAPNGRLLAVCTNHGVAFIDVELGIVVGRWEQAAAEGTQVVRFLDDGRLCTYGENGWLVWPVRYDLQRSLVTIGPPRADTRFRARGLKASASRDGRVIAVEATQVQGDDYRAVLVASRREEAVTAESAERPGARRDTDNSPADFFHVIAARTDVRSLSVSPDGSLVATGLHSSGDDVEHNAHVWDTSTGTLVTKLASRCLCQVQFSPQGNYLIVHSDESRLCRVFRRRDWQCVFTVAARGWGRFSLDESLFAIESGLGEVSLRRGADFVEFARLATPDETSYFPLEFTQRQQHLLAWNSETYQLHAWNLGLLRRHLEERDLSAGWPEISYEPRRPTLPPLRLEILPPAKSQ